MPNSGHESYQFALPKKGVKVPSGPDWFHEVKQTAIGSWSTRDGDDVRLLTKGGHNCVKRLPSIAETALKIRTKQIHRGSLSAVGHQSSAVDGECSVPG